jgi:acyl-CoA thioesterase-2
MASVPTDPDDAPHERAARGQLPASVDQLLTMLDLERLDRDLYRAPVTDRREEGRLFGGMVAAQALRAATLTVETDHHVHSLHGYFLRPGKPRAPLLLHVDRIRDGRSFTTRRVVARQDGEAIFSLSSSFHKDEPDGEYASPIPAGVPDPDADVEWYASPIRNIEGFSPLELRNFAPTPADERGHIESTRRVWVRTRGALPDDRALHACVLTFVSDMGAVLAAAIAVGGTFGTVMGASLDHAVWFHRLVTGSFHSRDGVHGASVAQEALVRHMH